MIARYSCRGFEMSATKDGVTAVTDSIEKRATRTYVSEPRDNEDDEPVFIKMWNGNMDDPLRYLKLERDSFSKDTNDSQLGLFLFPCDLKVDEFCKRVGELYGDDVIIHKLTQKSSIDKTKLDINMASLKNHVIIVAQASLGETGLNFRVSYTWDSSQRFDIIEEMRNDCDPYTYYVTRNARQSEKGQAWARTSRQG
jgi:hypothetical protein